MSKKYLIGIDGGTQSTKITIFDLKGNVICEAKRPLKPCVARKVGYAEHPGDDLWETFVLVCRDLLKKFTGDLKEIAGIGLCTIRSCRTFLREDGTLARPVMSWLDSRCYGPIDAGNDVSYVSTTTGYFTRKLTGNCCDTVANNTEAQWPVDPCTWNWSDNPQKYGAYNISRERLFSLQLPGSILGYVTPAAAAETGLPVGTPVVATANDKAVEALGSGLVDSNFGLVSLGTYITSMIPGQQYQKGASDFWTNFSCIPYMYLYESSGIWRGMWIVSWLVKLLGDEIKLKAEAEKISPEEFLGREAAQVPAGSEGLLTLPEWQMSSDLPHKKGIMMGFDVRHTRAHMFRSIMEGIAMTMHRKFKKLCDTVDLCPKQIIVSGGGSNSDLFMQIFADIFGIPAVRNVVNSAAGLGAAICAAVGTKVYDSFDSAVKNMVKVRDVFEPNGFNHKLYTRINGEVFSKMSSNADALLRSMHSILK
jgi:sugar (pentulose or hexulose) kinase